MCETSNQSEPPAPKRLSDLGEYDPAKVDKLVPIENITDQVRWSATQVIGMRPPERTPRLSAACLHPALEAHRRKWKDGSQEAARRLAATLFYIGETRRRLGCFEEALARYDEVLAVHHQLTAQRSGEPSADEVSEESMVLIAKSHALFHLEQFEAALATAQGAVKILEPLATADGAERWKVYLLWALRWKGRALDRLHRSFEASACHQRATELAALMLSQHGWSNGKSTDNES